jgi:tRNA(fMet)-specific endonuclease VapC
MLDTNIVVYAKNNRPEAVRMRMSRFNPDDLCISSIALAELECGVFNSSDPGRNQLALSLFLASLEIVPFDDAAALEYGRIRADLKRKGALIGANDLLIAAHAKSLALTLVTNNTREFERVEGLAIEDWAS